MASKQRTAEELWAEGYRVRVWPGAIVGMVEIIRPEAKAAQDGIKRYLVDGSQNCCSCAFGWKQSNADKKCCHVAGLGDLIAAEIVESGKTAERWTAMLSEQGLGLTYADRDWITRNAQNWVDRAAALGALVDNLPGGTYSQFIVGQHDYKPSRAMAMELPTAQDDPHGYFADWRTAQRQEAA